MSQLIPLSFNKIMQSRTYTVIILGTEQKKFAIYTEPQVGHHIQLHLAQGQRARPYTYDLLDRVVKGLNVKLLQVVISDVEDAIYYARLFAEQQIGDEKTILEIDARPSDCITLAIIHKIPLYCTHEVLERAVAVED
ncbi:MAG: bifunctional nuclease family protein [Verrucomicrobia bacterium]|nr:bifunctional nuclease family protein [Verrucomicrobiota bacterium]